MYCGEGDFDYCCEAIKLQKNVNVTHHVIKNKPEKEAHNNLWSAWREAKKQNNYDMFVKVDADTVINEDALYEFWLIMKANPRVTGMQAPLVDFFTLKFINGLNCFGPSVEFLDTTNELYCDRNVDVGHDLVIKADLMPEKLRPAGYHCFFSLEKQAFHFGVHRGLKKQFQIYDDVESANKIQPNKKRALALIGFASAKNFELGGFNYNDELFNQEFNIALHKLGNNDH